MGAALCAATNDWVARELLDREPRLRASILVPPHNVELALKEIERVANDRRFVQVLLFAMGDMLLGRRLSGSEAAEWGIVHRAVPSGRLDAELDELVDQLASGPTVISMISPAVRSNRLYRSSGGLRSFPSTASRYSPAVTLTPGCVSGARSWGFQFSPSYTRANRYRPFSTR